MPPASRRPRSRQPELFPRSKRPIIEITPNHRLVQITEEIDWTELEELRQRVAAAVASIGAERQRTGSACTADAPCCSNRGGDGR